MKLKNCLIALLLIIVISAATPPAFAAGITIDSGATVTLSGSPTITTIDVTINGTLSAGAGTINVSGNYVNSGIFTAGSSTVVFDGAAAQTVTTGSSNWNEIQVTNTSVGGVTFLDGFTTAKLTDTTANSNLFFASLQVFQITAVGGLTFTGASGELIGLRRYGGSGTEMWGIYPSGGGWSVSYVDVKDSNNIAYNYINPSNSVDSTNNRNWFSPTMVKLTSFNALGYKDRVEVSWQTGCEIDNVGFNLYRSFGTNDQYQKLNSKIIPGLGDTTLGNTYSFIDTDINFGGSYFYKLEDIDRFGIKTEHGPIPVNWQK